MLFMSSQVFPEDISHDIVPALKDISSFIEHTNMSSAIRYKNSCQMYIMI